MKPRIPIQGPLLFNSPCTVGRSSGRRHVTSTSSSASSPPKQRLWIQLAVVTATAAGIGAFIRSQQDSKSSTLNPVTFTKYSLISREPVSSNGSIFTLKPSKASDGTSEVYKEAWRTGVWSVMFKQPQLQIGRDYTPLPPKEDEDDNDSLRFFIRKDPFGEVSRYLHSLDIGASVEIRGPRIECEIPSDVQQILFIAGGTGIAPALQAGHTLLSRTDQDQSRKEKPRIHILWANRRRDDCLGGLSDMTMTQEVRKTWFSGFFKSSSSSKPNPSPADPPRDDVTPSLVVREIEALKSQYPGQVTVEYFVDEESAFISSKAITNFTNSTPSSSGSQKSKLLLVSGPEGFISYMAGPKLWAQGMELQGPLQGIIKELNLEDWVVWKL